MIITHTVMAGTQVDARLSIINLYSKLYKIMIIYDAKEIDINLWQMTIRITKVITYKDFKNKSLPGCQGTKTNKK